MPSRAQRVTLVTRLLTRDDLVVEDDYNTVKSPLHPAKHGTRGRPTAREKLRLDSHNARKQHFLMCINRAGLGLEDLHVLIGNPGVEQIRTWWKTGKNLDEDTKNAIARMLSLEADEIFSPDGAKF